MYNDCIYANHLYAGSGHMKRHFFKLIFFHFLKPGVLSGYVDVNVHDKVWAEAHIGMIGKQWDIILVEICFRGRLSYNLNIIKVGKFILVID